MGTYEPICRALWAFPLTGIREGWNNPPRCAPRKAQGRLRRNRMKTSRKVLGCSTILLAGIASFWTRPWPEAAANRAPAAKQPSFTLFESGQVRPLALSPNGRLLFACNTPDNRLEGFRVTRHDL